MYVDSFKSYPFIMNFEKKGSLSSMIVLILFSCSYLFLFTTISQPLMPLFFSYPSHIFSLHLYCLSNFPFSYKNLSPFQSPLLLLISLPCMTPRPPPPPPTHTLSNAYTRMGSTMQSFSFLQSCIHLYTYVDKKKCSRLKVHESNILTSSYQ